MGKVTLAAALFFSVVACEVVVTPEEEANRSPSFIEYLLAHAEVVDSYQQEGPCPEVQDEVRIKYFSRPPQYCLSPGSNLTLLCPTGSQREAGEKRGSSGEPGSCCRAQIFLEQRELAASKAEDQVRFSMRGGGVNSSSAGLL